MVYVHEGLSFPMACEHLIWKEWSWRCLCETKPPTVAFRIAGLIKGIRLEGGACLGRRSTRKLIPYALVQH